MPAPLGSEITPEPIWRSRRRLLVAGALSAGGAVAPRAAAADETITPRALFTRHNNYYEFSTVKDVVWKLAEEFRPRPWTLLVDGEVERPITWDLDALETRFAPQDRVYRLRCVEGWSAVVPWRGIELRGLLAASAPKSSARYVEFVSVLRPSEMIGQRRPVLQWPYREALRIDEAMHPLTLLAIGAYGESLQSQNGAPLRLVVPWKYGFKSAKAIARIRLVERAPATSWMQAQPSEYGFFANVNPDVPHPRWAQRRERRLGETLPRATLPFNGYAEQVAALYAGMDLARDF